MGFGSFVRPKISDMGSAKRVSRWGLAAIAISLLGQIGVIVAGGNASAFISIIFVFFLLGIGIFFHSRIAIVVLLIFYAFSLMFLLPFLAGILGGEAGTLLFPILVSTCFTLLSLHLAIQACNAIFAYHRLSK